MAPRKRGRPRPAQEPEPEPEPGASDHSSTHSNQEVEDDDEQQVRFYNTTFSTFRVSPLYIGSEPLNTTRLETISRRLRDTLVGDVVRGVQVGLENDASLGRTGALESVQWRWAHMSSLISITKNEDKQVLCLELVYENVTFSALLLPSLTTSPTSQPEPSWTWTTSPQDSAQNNEKFLYLPLLLTRMPTPLKSVLVDFLSNTFDTRISALHLGTRTLIRSWETWVSQSGVRSGKQLTKDVALTLGFHIPPPSPSNAESPSPLGLKTIDVVIPAPEVQRFLLSSASPPSQPPLTPALMQKLTGGNSEEGWSWRTPSPNTQLQISQPFTEALAAYLSHHLALNIFHPSVRVLRVTCDAFALSDGRVKLFTPKGDDKPVVTFLENLVCRAEGPGWSKEALDLAALADDDSFL
ncbi:hypothetical protein GGR57DRAFT_181298 [Xylariaceae sp. FL1272]|nr:hypothetical protein GGR57DRAFT_181298 [Xylariaceae sp. FL1272]